MVEELIYAAAAVIDDRILRLCENYDFLAAEARYRKECYVQYIKQAKQNERSETKEVVQKSQYEIAEEENVTCLMKYIRKEFLYKKQLALMTDLIPQFERTMNGKRFAAEESPKKKLRKKIKDEFCTSTTLLENNEEKLIFLPKDLSRDNLAIKVMEVQKKLNLYKQDSSAETSPVIAAEIIPKEIKWNKQAYIKLATAYSKPRTRSDCYTNAP